MFFDVKFFTILAFIIINFLIIFVVKTRNTLVISLIISHLVALLFFSISISNYVAFKEIALGLIIYSMVVLFLISNYNYLKLNEDVDLDEKKYSLKFIVWGIISFLIIFLLIFTIIKSLPEISKSYNDKKSIVQSSAILDGVNNKDIYSKNAIQKRKNIRLHNNLSDNFLLKRSSDVILIISCLIALSLLFSKKKI